MTLARHLLFGCAAVTVAAVAAPLSAQAMGPRAQATIVIRASVMPRFRLEQATAGAEPAVAASNAPELRIRLVPDQVAGIGDGDAASSADKHGPARGPHVLLIVPD